MSISINEIAVSTTGVDAEFLELIGPPNTSLAGLTLLQILPGGEITAAIELSGETGDNGYFLLASPAAQQTLGVIADQAIANNTFDNGSRTYLLVDGFSGSVGDDIDVNDNGLIDNVQWVSIVDSVAPIDNDSPVIYSPNVIGPDGVFLAPGGYRDPEGNGEFVMHAFADFSDYSPTAGHQPLVINEIAVSTTGVDKEFVELFGKPNTDLSSLSLLEIASGGEVGDVIALSGATGDNGYFLLASPAAEATFNIQADQSIADNTFSNVSRTYLLVDGFTGSSGDDIDADNDGSIDNPLWTAIVDSVAPIDNDSPVIYSQNVIGPDGSFLAPGGYRDPTGVGGFVMHQFADLSAYTPTRSNPDVVINEIAVSTTGVDKEFVEFYGAPNTDLSALSLLEVESGGEIGEVIALTGQTRDDGYFLLASPAAEEEFKVVADQSMADNTFSNGSRTYLLVENFSGSSGDDIDADDDGSIDNLLWTSIVDSVAPIDNDSPVIYSQNVIGPDGSFLAPGGYRDPEGSGDFVMHDFFDLSGYTPAGLQALVINEISVSTTGVDKEFLELFGAPNTDLSTLSLLEIESGGQVGEVIALSGQTRDDGYFLLASPATEEQFKVVADQSMADNTFSNGSRTYLLVENFSGSSGDDIDADDNGSIDNVLWTSIVDSVAPIDNDSPVIYSQNVIGPDGSFLAPGGYRDPEGSGDFVMHDFFDLSGYTPAGLQALVINEISVSTTGVDAEFLELYAAPNTDLTGVSVLEIASGGEIESVIDLHGQTGDNGYFLLASPQAETVFSVTGDIAIADNTFSNASRTYLLVENFTGAAGDDIDSNDNGAIDNVLWASIIDSVAPIDNDSPLIYSSNVIGPDGSFLAPGGFRDPTGKGDFEMHGFFDLSTYTPTAAWFASTANTPPAANDDAVLTEQATPVVVDAVANDSDADGDPLDALVVSQPTNGLALVVDDGIAYIPDAGFVGSDTFDYQLLDGQGGSDTAGIDVTVVEPASEISGTAGRDLLSGTPANDVIFGEDNVDRIAGNNGNDVLLGGNGIDMIDGGAGNDIIFSGSGRGILVGGPGADLFVITDTDDIDFLRDFESGTDQVLLAIETLLTADGLLDASKVQVVDTTGDDLLLQADLGAGFQTLANLNDAAGNSLDDVLFNRLDYDIL